MAEGVVGLPPQRDGAADGVGSGARPIGGAGQRGHDLRPRAYKVGQDRFERLVGVPVVLVILRLIEDIEREVFLLRIRRTAAEDRPALEVFDETQYHKDHWNADEPLEEILADFVSARAEIVAALASAADWSRAGTHAIRGPVSLRWQADYALGHTWEHLSQMMRVRLAYEVSAHKS